MDGTSLVEGTKGTGCAGDPEDIDVVDGTVGSGIAFDVEGASVGAANSGGEDGFGGTTFTNGVDCPDEVSGKSEAAEIVDGT